MQGYSDLQSLRAGSCRTAQRRQADPEDWILDGKGPLSHIVADTDRRVDRPLLHGLCAGRKHADREFEIPVHSLAGRPVLRCLWYSSRARVEGICDALQRRSRLAA